MNKNKKDLEKQIRDLLDESYREDERVYNELISSGKHTPNGLGADPPEVRAVRERYKTQILELVCQYKALDSD